MFYIKYALHFSNEYFNDTLNIRGDTPALIENTQEIIDFAEIFGAPFGTLFSKK